MKLISLLLHVLLLTRTNHYLAIIIYAYTLCLMFCKIYFIYVYMNTYKYLYTYMYVYIWEYANWCKLTFTWWVYSLGFRFVYLWKVERYFCSKKWRVVIHVAKKCRNLYCKAEGFIAQQKGLLHSRKLYCTIESFTVQQKVLLHSRKFYCTVEKLVLW